jgi:hypothetical protein
MNGRGRWLRAALAAFLLLGGGAAVHYTDPDGLKHHREWARQHHAPEPGGAIFYGGVLSVALGAGLGGSLLSGRGARGPR